MDTDPATESAGGAEPTAREALEALDAPDAQEGQEAREEEETPGAPVVRRSDATRAAILRAARDRFAADGYDRATIRAIARDADIDPSMVMRYYGTKERLFAAASEIDLRMPDLGRVPREEAGVTLVRHFLARWEQDGTLNAMLRVGVTNPAGAERMQRVFAEQVEPLARAVCPDPDPAEAERRAALTAAQILGLALSRYVLKLRPAVALTGEEIVAWVAPTIQRYLTAPHP